MASLNGLSFNRAFDDRLELCAEYLMNSQDPSGRDVAYGDSDWNDYRELLKSYGDLYDNKGLQYFGSGGLQGAPPAHRSVMYPIGLFAMMRTGWKKSDKYLHFSNQDGNHGNPDLLHINVYAYDRMLLVDPGRHRYGSDPVTNWLRRSTISHNTIEINDAPMIKSASNRSFGGWITNGHFDYIEGSHNGYEGFVHSRHILFIKPDYWIVSDYVTAPEGRHSCRQTWHCLPSANLSLDSASKAAATAFGSGANIRIVPADPDELAASLDWGYYAPFYNSAVPALYVSYTKKSAGDAAFDTVLVPTPQGASGDVRVNRLDTAPSSPTAAATALKIELRLGSDPDIGYFYLSRESSSFTPKEFGACRFDGKLAYLQTSAAGTIRTVLLVEGNLLKYNGEDIIRVGRGNIKYIAMKWTEGVLDICTDSIMRISDITVKIYAPSASSVNWNGRDASFARVGDYVYVISDSASRA